MAEGEKNVWQGLKWVKGGDAMFVVFCEDCGAKNFLPPDQPQGESGTFRCSACNYKNIVSDPGEKARSQSPPKTKAITDEFEEQ